MGSHQVGHDLAAAGDWVVKNLPAKAGNTGDVGLIPELRRSPGEGNGNPLRYSCLKIPWTEEAGSYSPQGLKESDTTEPTHTHTHTHTPHSQKINKISK